METNLKGLNRRKMIFPSPNIQEFTTFERRSSTISLKIKEEFMVDSNWQKLSYMLKPDLTKFNQGPSLVEAIFLGRSAIQDNELTTVDCFAQKYYCTLTSLNPTNMIAIDS